MKTRLLIIKKMVNKAASVVDNNITRVKKYISKHDPKTELSLFVDELWENKF